MYVTPTRAHPQQYNDPSPPFIDDHRYYNVEGKVKLFRRSGARKNLLNMYYIRLLCLDNNHPGMGNLHHHQHLEFGKMLKKIRFLHT